MKYSFKATIYKVGINPCVKVPFHISQKMKPVKGYIPVKGTINGYPFIQTLVPIKNAEYRLYVNGPMLKGSRTKNGDKAMFVIEQDVAPRTVEAYPMPTAFKKRLDEENLYQKFKQMTPSRQKEVLKYLNYLKTDEALTRNVEKVIKGLKRKSGNNWFVNR